MIWVSGSGKLI